MKKPTTPTLRKGVLASYEPKAGVTHTIFEHGADARVIANELVRQVKAHKAAVKRAERKAASKRPD